MERETGIGPATNSLEGCDSTTELLPRLLHKIMELMMGLEPMTSPLPRECSTTELHQPSFDFRSSSRARMLAMTTRNAKSPRNKIGIHRSCTSRPSYDTNRLL